MIITEEDYLEHFGVKGMKWGVRRYQNKDGSLTSRGKKKYKRSEESEENEKERKARRKRNIKIAVGVGVGVAAAAVAAYGIYKMNSSGNNIEKGKSALNKLTRTQKDLMNREYDASLKLFKRKDDVVPGEQGFLLDANSANRGRVSHPKDRGYNANCTFCSTAYELRRRGYDVYANKTSSGRSLDHAATFFKGTKIHKGSDYVDIGAYTSVEGNRIQYDIDKAKDSMKKILDQIVAEGEGSRGNLSGIYYFGGGHSMAYEVRNGKVILVDGQVGELHDSSILGSIFKPEKLTWFRTDNLEINPDTIKEAVYTVGEKVQDRTVGDYDSTLANVIRKSIISKMKEGMSMSEARVWANERYGSNL